MGLHAGQTDVVQPAHDEPPPPVVLGVHLLDEGFAYLQRLQGRPLRGRGRRHDEVLVDLAHL